MPKKKLTKAQVKRKLNTMNNSVYDLIMDKTGHSDSSVPMSLPKLLDFHKLIRQAELRAKK